MNEVISWIFILFPIVLFLAIGIWRRNQIYHQEEQAERERQGKQ